jgi:hypothetical protein
MIASVIGHVEWWETVTLGRGSFRRGLRRVTRSINEEKAKQQQFQWTTTPPLMMAMVSVVHRIRSQGIVKDRLGDQRGGSAWEPIKILLEGGSNSDKTN